MKHRQRAGFTIIESLIVVGLILFLAVVTVGNLGNRKGYQEFTSTAEKVVAMLNDARDRSIVQEGGVAWQVLFRVTTTTEPSYSFCRNNPSMYYFDHFALKGGASYQGRFALPKSVTFYDGSSSGFSGGPCAGPTQTITFGAVNGLPGDPQNAWVRIFMVGAPAVSTTISVSPLGLVTFTTSSYWSGF